MAKVALLLSAVALGLAALALTRRPPEPPRTPAPSERFARASELEALRQEFENLKGEKAAAPAPPIALPDPKDAPELAEGGEQLQAIVDDAVARKTEQVIDELRVKANRKPAMDVFARTLDLTDEQRAVAARVVVEGQRELHAILATPTHDGANLLEELVEVAARGLAEPGKDRGFGTWLARVLTEKVPGTDETYGTRIETVKKRMRAAFRRDWSEAQYQEYESWGVDPTEIESVPESPNEALMKRITERARQLGATLPSD